MPSPIAHAVTGYCLAQVWPRFQTSLGWPARRVRLGVGIFAAIAADVDFLPQLLAGIDTHRGLTHSLGAAMLVSVLLAALVGRRSRRSTLIALGLALSAYLLHLAMDLLTAGGSGLPALWPLSSALVQSPVAVFPQVHHSEGLFYRGHVKFLLFESVYSLLLMGLVQVVWRSRRRPSPASEAEPPDKALPSSSTR